MFLTFAKLVAATVLTFVSGRANTVPVDRDWLDTVVMDMECDVDPECEITYINGESAWVTIVPTPPTTQRGNKRLTGNH